MRNELKPVPEPFDPAVAEILRQYPQRDGYILQLFRVFANSQRFLKKGTINLLDRNSPISMREREIVILRVCANNNCEYEWGVHVTAFSEHVGLTPVQVSATRQLDHEADCWDAAEATLILVTDELCRNATLCEETKTKFQELWNLEQQLEIIAICGNYHTISFVANTSGIPGETFGAKFPA